MGSVTIKVSDAEDDKVSLIVQISPPVRITEVTVLTPAQDVGLRIAEFARKLFDGEPTVAEGSSESHTADCDLWTSPAGEGAECSCGARDA